MSARALPAPATKLFRYLFEQASLGIAVEDLDGNLLLANPALCTMLGYTEKELCGMSCSQFANPEDSENDWALFQQLRAGVIDHYSLEKRYIRKDGAQLWGNLNVSLLKEGDEEPPLVFAFVEEITERKLTEQNLAKSNERFRLAVEASKSVAWEWDLKSGRDSWFGDLQTMFGIPSDAFVGRLDDFYRYVHPNDRQMVAKAVSDARENRKPYAAEFRVVRDDGTVRWVSAKGSFYYGANGEAERMLGMAADITERKQAEEALERSESNYRMFVAQSSEGIFCRELGRPIPVGLPEDEQVQRILHESYMAECNQAFARMYGMSPGDFIGKRLEETLDVENPVNIELTREYVRGGYRVVDRESHEVDQQGNPKVFLNSMIGFVENGTLLRTWGIQRDITERRQMEKAHAHAEQVLRESEDKLRLLLDSTAEAIYGIDLEHRCTFCNPACLRILGYERIDEVLGKNMHELMHDTRPDGTPFPVEECRVHQVIRTGEGTHADDEMVWRANGTSFPAEYWSYPQRRGQELVGAVVAFIDITQRKLAEAALAGVSRKLIEAQEHERTRIARELHDDIGQRLAMLAIEIEQLQEASSDLPAKVRSRVVELWKQTSEIATDLQSISHELHSSKLQYLGVTAAIRSFCNEFGEQQKVEIEFTSHDFPSALPPDISLCLFRVLQEALHNSAKHSGVRHFVVRLWATSDELHLTVRDFGAGFDTDSAKTSRGLGLISMEERLKLVNGTLSIDSRRKVGTTIHARVPFVAEGDSMLAAG